MCKGARGTPLSHAPAPPALEYLEKLYELQRIVALYRSHPDYAAPDKFVRGIKELVDSGKLGLEGPE